MTLAVAFKGPEGLVLAADSRITITATVSAGERKEQYTSYFDNATKLFGVNGQPHVGVLTHGNTMIGTSSLRTVHGFMPEFEAKLGSGKTHGRMKVESVAAELANFYADQWSSASMPDESEPVLFKVAGFDQDEAYGRVYEVSVPNGLEPVEYLTGDAFGVRWGGQSFLANRWLNGVDPGALALVKDQLGLTDLQVEQLEQKWQQELPLRIPWQVLPLQDCVDLATFLVAMTSASLAWTFIGYRGVGGAADVATITRNEGFQPIQMKRLHVRDWLGPAHQ